MYPPRRNAEQIVPACLYRLAEPADWQQAQQTGFFASADLAAEGFIHTSDLPQVLATAHRYYAGYAALVLLEIEVAELKKGGVRMEREWIEQRGAAFAHVFGPVPQLAIRRHWVLQPTATGEFELPAELQQA